MLIWAAIALLQAVALPGFLLTRLLRLDGDSRLQTAGFSFGLSLLANHFLVVLLVLTGAFQRPVLVGIIVLELLAIGALTQLRRASAPAVTLRESMRSLVDEPRAGLAPFWPGMLALAALAYLVAQVPDAFSHTFQLWDTVQSWNRWALDWEAGLFPAWMMAYPQLLPTNWALLYVIQGNTLQFAAHGIMALFPLAIGALLLDLGLRRRDAAYLLAVPLATVLLVLLLEEALASGHADVPLAFFAVLTLHLPLVAEPWQRREHELGRFIACALAAGAAALTKQPGLFVIAVLPIFLWRALAPRPMPERLRIAALSAAGAFAVAAPWYLYVVYRIANGLDWNNANDLGNAISEIGGPAAALDFLIAALSAPGLALLLGLLAVSLVRREARWLVLGIVAPFLALWVWKASYGTRNAALAVPFAATAAAMGLAELSVRGRPWLQRGALLLALAGGVGLLARVDPKPITAHAEAEWLAFGDTGFRRALLTHWRGSDVRGRILADDRFLLAHPELRDAFFIDRDAPAEAFWPFWTDRETFARILTEPSNEIRYVLITRTPFNEIAIYLREEFQAGRLELVLRGEHARLFRVRDATGDRSR